jgi:hypothetical protein
LSDAEKNDDSHRDPPAAGVLIRYGERKRERMLADSKVSFGKFLIKTALSAVFLLVDFLLIPSVFQMAGLFDAQMAVPIVIVLLAAAAAEIELLSRIK